MRLLMLNNEFPPLGGGTGVVNYHILEKFAGQTDVWVDLVTSSCSSDRRETEQFSERIQIYKVPVDNRNIHHASNVELIRYAWRGLRLSQQLLKTFSYDASFAFAGVPAGAISYALKLTANLPYLVSLQGADVPGFESRYLHLYPILKPLLRLIWQQAAVVTAISQEHKQLAHKTLSGFPITIIPNGVDTQTFCPPAAPRDTDQLNILCVGRLIERKGQRHLLKAFARLRASIPARLHLTLVGAGDSEPGLRRLAQELKLNGDVTFAGPVGYTAMPAVYRQADIFVLPSQTEGMSIAILEALATGLPVVVTPTDGALGLVVDGVHGRVVPWADVPALAEALQQLTNDDESRQRMGEASRRRALDYTWSAIAQKYLDLCSTIMLASKSVVSSQPSSAANPALSSQVSE
jgi:glycosyltransferase involved in cell wall biosynthesis